MLGGGLAKSLLARLHGLWIMMFRAMTTICGWVLISKEFWLRAEATLANGLAPVLWASMIAVMTLMNLIALALTGIKNWTAKLWKPLASTAITVITELAVAEYLCGKWKNKILYLLQKITFSTTQTW